MAENVAVEWPEIADAGGIVNFLKQHDIQELMA